MQRNEYTICNIAGGDLRKFRLNADGQISDASVRHARRQGLGGAWFSGPAGEVAEKQYEENEQ